MAVAERRQAQKQLERFPCRVNIIRYKEKTAKAKKICKESKRKSFHLFVEDLTYDTPCGTVWKKIKSLKIGNNGGNIPIEVQGNLITDAREKANIFAKKFQSVAVAGKHRMIIDFKQKLKCASEEDVMEGYNGEIIQDELLRAVRECKNKSPGWDEIPNILIKHFPISTMNEFLNIINQSFMTGQVPDCWKLGVVVPILKPGKINTEVSSYRPITLLSWLGKIMEQIVKHRLQYLVDKFSLLDKCQYGFCKGQSTLDIHIRIENDIRQVLGSNGICVIIYVDLSSAFDTVWPEWLISKLIDKGVRGKLIVWLYDYLCNRKIKVRVEGYYSEEVSIGASTPQGAVLSPLLFNLMLSDMPHGEMTNRYVYADDITLVCS